MKNSLPNYTGDYKTWVVEYAYNLVFWPATTTRCIGNCFEISYRFSNGVYLDYCMN
jgi:hypothetical protein